VSLHCKKTRSELLAADADVGTEEQPLLVTHSTKFTFSCCIAGIEQEGKKVTALDVPVASWNIDESFSAGKATVYRLSGVAANGVTFTAEMTVRDCDYRGYGWPAAMSEDLVIPTFERLLAESKELPARTRAAEQNPATVRDQRRYALPEEGNERSKADTTITTEKELAPEFAGRVETELPSPSRVSELNIPPAVSERQLRRRLDGLLMAHGLQLRYASKKSCIDGSRLKCWWVGAFIPSGQARVAAISWRDANCPGLFRNLHELEALARKLECAGEELKQMRDARDRWRELDPRIDELMAERDHAIDAEYSEETYEEYAAEVDCIEDNIIAIVGEENYERFQQDFSDDIEAELEVWFEWREEQLALGRDDELSMATCVKELLAAGKWPDKPELRYAKRRHDEREKERCAAEDV
jgi:hypothetical protein